MTPEHVMARLRETEAILDGHFSLSSGRHSDRYVQCARLLAATPVAAEMGAALAAQLPADVDLVVSPAMGGLIIGHEVARARQLPFLFTEREDGAMVFRRGFAVPPGARAVVVEDVVTSGGSLLEAAAALRAAGGTLVAAAAIVDRSGGAEPDFGVPFHSLIALEVKTWSPQDCPLCAAGGTAVKPGSRHLGKTRA